MRTMAVVRGLAAAGTLGATLALTSAPAQAYPSVVHGPCDGSAIINGKTYTPANDTVGNPVHVPDKGFANYFGSTGTVTAPHHGHLAVQIGPSKITIYSWASPNDGHKLSSRGQQNLKKAYDKLPFGIAGIYKLYGYHYTDSGQYCWGYAYVKFDKSPLQTPIGIGAAIGTLITAAGVAISGLGKKALA